jgi:hypothetical protein
MASRYQPGDSFTLRPRALGSAGPNGAGNIVAVLPETQGAIRYRVRLEGETYDRNISEDDIDVASSAEPRSEDGRTEPMRLGSSWINSIAIKTKK